MSWTVDGVARRGIVVYPDKQSGPAPVVLAFHGHGDTNVNFAGVVLIGLGCEANQMDALFQAQQMAEGSLLKPLVIQTSGGSRRTIEAAVAAVEIVAGKNWRNLRVLLVLSVLIAGNAVFHAEVLLRGAADYGIRIGLAAVIMLIVLIGGRIVPSFTNNWLARNNPGRLPAPFSRFDAAVVGASAAALTGWVVAPVHPVAAVLLIVAGALQLVRLARWAGERATGEPADWFCERSHRL